MSETEYAESLPGIGGPEGYTGSGACKQCHEDQFASWHRSYHRTMTQFADGDAVKADFNNVVLTNENTRFTLMKRGSEHWMRAEPIHVPAGEPPPAPLELRLGLVTGSHHMQVFWVPEGHGNLQVGFPFTWLIPEQRWVPRKSTFLRPPDMHHGPEPWNVVCSRCHTTGVEPHARMAERQVETRVAELGISCEACHGPGAQHVAAQTSTPGGRPLMPREIVHPKEIPPERGSQICGFCHSMKWISNSENWYDKGFRFRPGDDLQETTPIIRPSRVHEVPGLREFLARNPELLDDFFWPDGMIRVSGREYNGLIESPCYQGGKFSCMSCHSLHDSDPDDQLAPRARGDGACIQCHDAYREPTVLAAHTHHSPGSPGSECYNCHMPHTTYGVLKAIRSHQVSSPRVSDELATGRPNACNLCHLDKPLRWTAGHLRDWYGQAEPDDPLLRTSTARSVQLALMGDAGQRATMAWHFGWDAAAAASGTNWLPVILAQLLDDPYAAVRCVAERSMRALSGPLQTGYDYSIDPRSRNPVRDEIWSKVRPPVSRPELLISTNLVEQRTAFDEALRQRDHRSIRLRE